MKSERVRPAPQRSSASAAEFASLSTYTGSPCQLLERPPRPSVRPWRDDLRRDSVLREVERHGETHSGADQTVAPDSAPSYHIFGYGPGGCQGIVDRGGGEVESHRILGEDLEREVCDCRPDTASAKGDCEHGARHGLNRSRFGGVLPRLARPSPAVPR